MNKLLGEIIRQKIREDGRTAKVVCAELGMSRGNLDKIYHKDSVNTDLLAKISEVLGYDFFVHVNPFRREELARGRTGSPFSLVEGNSEISAAEEKLGEAHAELERLEQEMAFLKANLQDLKTHLADKDAIISLQQDKVAYLTGEIQRLKALLDGK